MSLSARHIALQGIGASVLSLAMQGLVPVALPALGGGFDSVRDEIDASWRTEQERIQRQNDLIIMTVIAAVTGGMLT